jgi:hypothetical protein
MVKIKLVKKLLERIPFTLIMVMGLGIGALITNTTFKGISHHWLQHVGFAPNDLWYWRLERIVTSALVTVGGVVFWEALFFVAVFVGMAEWLTGWKRTASTFWGVHLLALVLLSLIVALAEHQLRIVGLEADLLARDVGPSAGYFACLGLVNSRMKHPWNLVSGAALFAMFVIVLFTPAAVGESATLKFSADLAHMLAFPLGWLFAGVGLKQISHLPGETKKA